MSTAVAQPLALEMRSITKTYPGVRALEDVSFQLKPGEIHALVGENGAGKSTLMKILSGAQGMDSGQILLFEQPVHVDSPQKAMALGVSTIYQEFNLVPYLNAAQDIFLGSEPRSKTPRFVDFGTMYRESPAINDRVA